MEGKINDRFTVQRSFIVEAHKAACDDWKKRIEDQFPEVFTEKRYDENKVYVTMHIGTHYKLQEILDSGRFAWISLSNSCCYANGTFPDGQDGLHNSLDILYSADSLEEFYKGKRKRIK
jgi:hypothetical protein